LFDATHPLNAPTYPYDDLLAKSSQKEELLVLTIEATGFLRHMVRDIVGTLVEVGCGARSSQSFAELLESRDRTKAGPTAPPHVLFLVEVRY